MFQIFAWRGDSDGLRFDRSDFGLSFTSSQRQFGQSRDDSADELYRVCPWADPGRANEK